MFDWNALDIRENESESLLGVHAQPGAKREEIVGEYNHMLKVAVTQKPTDGKANIAVVGLLSKVLRVAKTNIEIRSGHKARQKRVAIKGLSRGELLDRLKSHRS